MKYCSEKALECLLGATLGTQAGIRGARSLGLVQQDETEELVDWTALLFAGTMTATALRWLMDFNFADPTDNPVMELPGASRRDIAALANVVNTLVNLGLRVPESWAHAQFDIPQSGETTERLLTPSQNSSPDAPGNPLNGSAHREELILADLVTRLGPPKEANPAARVGTIHEPSEAAK